MQTLIVIGIVLAALAYLGSRGWRAYAVARASKDSAGCAGGCGCGDKH
jgi:hypothetical protein